MNRLRFLTWLATKTNVNSKWQLKLLKYTFYFINWLNKTECKNEGHLKSDNDFCPRCNEFTPQPIFNIPNIDTPINYFDYMNYIQVQTMKSLMIPTSLLVS